MADPSYTVITVRTGSSKTWGVVDRLGKSHMLTIGSGDCVSLMNPKSSQESNEAYSLLVKELTKTLDVFLIDTYFIDY